MEHIYEEQMWVICEQRGVYIVRESPESLNHHCPEAVLFGPKLL